MAMIKCAECGKEFSDRANACPNCGCPIEYQAEKSIGGDYHAADKLAPSVIVEHLTIAKELESERYTLQLAIAKIQSKINTLGYYNQFTPPKSVSVKKFFITALITLAILIPIYLVINSHIFVSYLSNLISNSYDTIDFMNNSVQIKIAISIIGPLCILAFTILNSSISAIRANSKYKNAVQQYNNLVNNDTARVNNENIQKQQLKQQINDMQDKINNISETLNQLYSLDIIHPKYRNMITVIRLLEYFDSGRCTALTGAGGAYNKYEKEIRQDAIISKLDVAINCLYQIKDNQYMLYETLEDCLDASDRIASQVSTLTDSSKNIEACSAVAAYNSKIAASNSNALVFIEAYKGANGL
jgi:uncharacterized protein YcgL (UPF0745 family)